MSFIINPYRFAAPPAGGGALLEDTFEGAGAATLLSAWTPTVSGTGWSKDPLGTATVDLRVETGGYVNPTADQENVRLGYFSQTDPATADVSVLLEIAQYDAVLNTNFLQAVARRQSTGAAYILFVRASPATIVIQRISSPTVAVANVGPAFTGLTPTPGDRVELRCVGSTISAIYTPNGGSPSTVISATDAVIASAGRAGLGFGYGATSYDIGANWRVGYTKIEEL